jgi:hypothetical protein
MVSWDSMALSWVSYCALQFTANALRTQAPGEAESGFEITVTMPDKFRP